VNTESERTGQELVVAKFEVLYQNLPGKTETKPLNKVASLWVKICTQHLQSMKQECYPLNWNMQVKLKY